MIWEDSPPQKKDPQVLSNWNATENAASAGDPVLLDWLINAGFPLSHLIPTTAAQSGHVSILQWCVDHGHKIRDLDALLDLALKSGRLSVVKWLTQKQGTRLSDHSCGVAAAGGHLDLLKFLRSCRCPWGSTLSSAAANGHLSILQWAHSKGASLYPEICEEAAAAGHLHILRWAREEGCEWNVSQVLIAAAAEGHLAILQYCTEQGAKLTLDVSTAALRLGHFDTVLWLYRNGCPVDEKKFVESATSFGNLAEVRWAISEANFSLSPRLMSLAAASGNLELLQYLFSLPNAPPLDGSVCEAAAKNGHFEVLQWLREVAKCDWDSRTTSIAYKRNYLSIFEWACANGCPYETFQFDKMQERIKRKRVQEEEGDNAKRGKSIQ